jgi:hypothetical protein
VKKYSGNEPDLSEWELLFIVEKLYNTDWIVFVRDKDDENRYLGLKVIADGFAENKANYWLSWDKNKNRITSKGLDAKLLKDNRPFLYDAVKQKLERI